MQIKQWLAGDVQAKAHGFARKFSESFPSSLESSTSRKAQEIGRRAFAELLEEIVMFQRKRRIGLVRKVLFARAFQNEMRNLGYSPSLIRQVTSEVLSKLAFATK